MAKPQTISPLNIVSRVYTNSPLSYEDDSTLALDRRCDITNLDLTQSYHQYNSNNPMITEEEEDSIDQIIGRKHSVLSVDSKYNIKMSVEGVR